MYKTCPACKADLPENVSFKSSVTCKACETKVQNQSPIQYLIVAILVVGFLMIVFGFPAGAGGAIFGKSVGGIVALIVICFVGKNFKAVDGTGNKAKVDQGLRNYEKKQEENKSKVRENIRKYKEQKIELYENRKWWQFWL